VFLIRGRVVGSYSFRLAVILPQSVGFRTT
jgi:hypothetical protein